MKLFFVLIFCLRAFAQQSVSPEVRSLTIADKIQDLEKVTGIRYGQYRLTSGGRECLEGEFRAIPLENRFTLAMGDRPLAFSFGIEEVVFNENNCRTIDRAHYSKERVVYHSAIFCGQEEVRNLVVVLEKTKEGFAYIRTASQGTKETSKEVCRLRFLR